MQSRFGIPSVSQLRLLLGYFGEPNSGCYQVFGGWEGPGWALRGLGVRRLLGRLGCRPGRGGRRT